MKAPEPAVDYGKRKYTIEEYLEMENEAFRLNDIYHWELEEYKLPGEQLYIKTINEYFHICEIYDGVKIDV